MRRRVALVAGLSALALAVALSWMPPIRATIFWYTQVDHARIQRAIDSPHFYIMYSWDRENLSEVECAERMPQVLHEPVRDYLTNWPNGPQHEQAERLLEALTWTEVLMVTPLSRLQGSACRWYEAEERAPYLIAYLLSYPNGVHAQQAAALFREVGTSRQSELIREVADAQVRSMLEDGLFERANDRATIRSLQLYLKAYPEGRNATAVRERIAAMRVNERL